MSQHREKFVFSRLNRNGVFGGYRIVNVHELDATIGWQHNTRSILVPENIFAVSRGYRATRQIPLLLWIRESLAEQHE
jgi:hypothetical protein